MVAKNNSRTGVILDTDIGYDADDFFALLLLLNSPELPLDLIVTGDETFGRRARLTQKILQMMGRGEIPVIAGADLGNSDFSVDEMVQDVPLLNADKDPIEEMKLLIDKFDEVIYLNIQGFSNLSALITLYPEVKKKLKVFQMGCALDYSRYENWIEHNVRIDIPAAQNVLKSGLDLTLIMTQTTMDPGYSFNEANPIMVKLHKSTDSLHAMLLRSVMRFHEKLLKKGVPEPWPYAHDPLAVSVALGKDFVQFEDITVLMNERGDLIRDPSGQKVRASKSKSQSHEFMQFLEERLF